MQRSLPCGQDPALPVLAALIKQLGKIRAADFSELL
jgi:hypothetical protein